MRRILEGLSAALALAGGAILAGIALLTTASILGRWLFATPIFGDVELVQTGCAMMIALALPYCQLKRAHIIVDFFTQGARPAVRGALDAFGSVALGLVCLVLAWRAGVGVAEMREAGETTMVLGLSLLDDLSRHGAGAGAIGRRWPACRLGAVARPRHDRRAAAATPMTRAASSP